MSHILAVRIPIGNRLAFFASGPYVVSVGDQVLCHVDGDLHMGGVERVSPLPEPVAGQQGQETHPIIFRPATEDDLVREGENRALASRAYEHCRQCIRERGLDMKLVDVVVLFDGSKILFFFTAPSRIDFRELVKDLVRAFRTRIELRQIGARHETQMVGGIGNCGQLVCCQRFLRQFAPATIKMAKEQNLFLNPAKISGVCNRLLCCLSFEQANYEEFLAQCPKVGKKFSTSLGPAKVIRANYFRRSLSIWLENGGEREIDLEEWFKLVASGRPAAAARQEPHPKAKIVEQGVVIAGQPEDLDSSRPASPPDGSGRRPETPRRPHRRDEQRPSRRSEEQQSTDGPDRPEKSEKPEKDGRGKPRKSKRRSRASRQKAASRGAAGGSGEGGKTGRSRKTPAGKPDQGAR